MAPQPRHLPAVGGCAGHAVHPQERRGDGEGRGHPDGRCHPRRGHLHHGPVRLRQSGSAAVLHVQQLDQTDPGHVHDRSGRHQPSAVRAVDGHHRAGDGLLVGPRAGAGQPEGVLHADARAPDGHGRNVHRPGPHPLLRLLRSRAPADVLHDRRVGRREPPIRVAEVLPLHDVRFGADARVVHRPVRRHQEPCCGPVGG